MGKFRVVWNEIYEGTYVRLRTSGTSQASEAWWKEAMGNSNSFVS